MSIDRNETRVFSRFSMFLNKRRDKLRLTKRSLNRIPTRWKLVIAGLIGSGTGLLILTMWSPRSIDDKSAYNGSSKLSPEIQYLGHMTNVGSRDDEKSSAYCKISGCNAVICLSIPESMNPGEVASDFITQKFKIQCPISSTIEELTFQSCTFPNKKLKRDWLTTNLPIEKLTFRNCALDNFPNGSFASTIFANLQTLEVATGTIRALQKWTFDELKNLKNLLIDDNIVHVAEYDLLSSVADSLEILVLDSCLRDIRVLANITTSHRSLSRVQILSIQRNSLGTITSEIFKSIPNVVSLYLGHSEIQEIQFDTLKSTRSLKLLHLNNNLLKILPPGIFSSVLTKNPDLKISMTENPWNCSCELEWISDLIKNYPSILTEIPQCETPERNALVYFTSAKFCDNSTTLASTATVRTTTSIAGTTRKNTSSGEEGLNKYVTFTCRNYETLEISRAKRKLFSTEEWKFPSRFPNFSVRPLDNGDVLINLRIHETRVSLIWFQNIEGQTDDTLDTIDCVKNIRDSFVLTDLAIDSSYTICLLEDLEKAPSPLNCLAARTAGSSIYSSKNDDIWLTKEEKSLVISISISLLLIVSLLSVLSSFWVIRRNPSLLRGSKRIIMVKKRGVEALVMPRGVSENNTRKDEEKFSSLPRIFDDEKRWSNKRCAKKNYETTYLTPLENHKSLYDRKNSSPRETTRPRKDSKISRISSQCSAGSYVSGIEATPSELYNWRNNARIKTYYSACMESDEFDETPPLPPHRSFDRSIPSLSLAIDSSPEMHRQVFSHF